MRMKTPIPALLPLLFLPACATAPVLPPDPVHATARDTAVPPASVAAAELPSRPQLPVPPLPYTANEVTVVNPDDGVVLAGTLTIPSGDGPFPAVYLASGSGIQDRDYGNYPWHHPTFLVLADQLTRQGVAVLRLDDRGIGGSGGSRHTTNDEVATDALAAVNLLRSHPGIDAARVGIVGHSWGGIVAGLATARSDAVGFIIALGGSLGMPWSEAMAAQRVAIVTSNGAPPEVQEYVREYWMSLQAAAMSHPDSATAAERVQEFMIADRPRGDAMMPPDAPRMSEERWQQLLSLQARVLVNRWYIEQLHLDPAEYLPRIRVPVLALTGSLDTSAPPENLNAMAAAFRSHGHRQFTAEVLPHVNHFLQTAEPETADAFAQIEETVAPIIVRRIVTWLRELKPAPIDG
jgi:uncharacterized protein